MFSFGKRTFLTAPPDDWSEYIVGPVPGPAAILVIGLSVPPEDAYEPGATLVLPLPEGGAGALSAFLWREIAKDGVGRPRLLDRAELQGGLFYAASERYALTRTCNHWSAEVLAAAGVPLEAAGVVLSGQVMDRVRSVALCPVPAG